MAVVAGRSEMSFNFDLTAARSRRRKMFQSGLKNLAGHTPRELEDSHSTSWMQMVKWPSKWDGSLDPSEVVTMTHSPREIRSARSVTKDMVKVCMESKFRGVSRGEVNGSGTPDCR